MKKSSTVAFGFLSNICIKPISTHSVPAHHLKNCRLEIVALAFLSTSLRKTDAPVILMFFGWQFKTSPVWPSQSHSLYISRVVGYLKVSKFRKQIILSSHSPKNQRKFSHFLALASKKPYKVVKTKDKWLKIPI